MQLNMNSILEEKEKICYCILQDMTMKNMKMIQKLKKEFKIQYILKENVSKEILFEVLENIVPSYMIVEDGELLELGPIIN